MTSPFPSFRHWLPRLPAFALAAALLFAVAGALAQEVDEMMAAAGIPLRRSEGAREGRWVVLDYGFIMVHIFHRDERAFYNLERLWSDGGNQLLLPFDQAVAD